VSGPRVRFEASGEAKDKGMPSNQANKPALIAALVSTIKVTSGRLDRQTVSGCHVA
jgi:hypothetical protein